MQTKRFLNKLLVWEDGNAPASHPQDPISSRGRGTRGAGQEIGPARGERHGGWCRSKLPVGPSPKSPHRCARWKLGLPLTSPVSQPGPAATSLLRKWSVAVSLTHAERMTPEGQSRLNEETMGALIKHTNFIKALLKHSFVSGPGRRTSEMNFVCACLKPRNATPGRESRLPFLVREAP